MSEPSLHYRCVGQGSDLILLHGWGLHADIWAPLIDCLATDFRLHLIDFPGHGSSADIEAFTLDALCELLSEVVPERADWLGWSLGGLVALEFSARYPARVRRLILLASNPCFVVREDWPEAMSPEVVEGFARDLLQDHQATLKRFLGLVAQGATDPAVLRELRQVMRAAPPSESALRGGLALLRDTDLRPRLQGLAMPVLLLGGSRDTLVPITALRRLKREYPQLQLQEFPQTGHAPFISQPQATALAIRKFCSE